MKWSQCGQSLIPGPGVLLKLIFLIFSHDELRITKWRCKQEVNIDLWVCGYVKELQLTSWESKFFIKDSIQRKGVTNICSLLTGSFRYGIYRTIIMCQCSNISLFIYSFTDMDVSMCFLVYFFLSCVYTYLYTTFIDR